MLDEATKTKLRDPAYFALHAQAIAALREVGRFAWYDSNFLRRFEAAKVFLASVRPDALSEFVAGFAPLRPPHGFEVQHLRDLFDERTRARILEISRAAQPGTSHADAREREDFGRFVIWDHPYFLDLQSELLPKVCELAGMELETGYNFLSLYGGEGKCEPHLDEPYSMFTLDYCIEQSEEWPIHFSRLVDWPTREAAARWDMQRLKSDADLAFAPLILKPNEAVFFSGSSQWHYRDAIPAGGFCSLLFFHYFPAGYEALVSPHKWAEYFDIPELRALCDLFGDAGTDGLF